MISLYTETFETLLANKHYGEESEDSSLTECLTLLRKFPNFNFNSSLVTLSFDMETLFMQHYDIREIGAETEELFLHFWRKKCNELLIKYTPKINMWIDNFNDLFKFTVNLEITDVGSKNNTRTDTRAINTQKTNTKTDTIKIETEDELTGTKGKNDTIETQNTYYLNPVTATTTNLKVQDVDKTNTTNSATDTNSENRSKTEQHSGAITDNGTNVETHSGNLADSGGHNRTIHRDVLQTVWGKTRAMILGQIFDLRDIYLDCLYEFETIFMAVY